MIIIYLYALLDREEGDAADGRQSMHGKARLSLSGAPALGRHRPRLIVDEIEAECHVTAVLFLSFVHDADVNDDVVERQSDLHQLSDDVMSVALPTRSAQICHPSHDIVLLNVTHACVS